METSGPGPGAGPGEFDDYYKREVLEPARRAGDQPPEDLRVRYQLREPLVTAEVAARVKQVRQCWRRSRGQLKYRKLVDRLEAEHREFAPLFASAENGDLRPLATRLRGGDELAVRRRAEAKARLADAAGAVRLLAPADVEGIARSTGVARDELRSLAKVDGVAIREPDPLPVTPPYQGYPRAREALAVLGRRHLADFLFDGPPAGPMRVLDGFAAPGVRLDPAAVATVSAQWAKRPRDTSSTNADTVLVMLKQCDRLDDLMLYDIVDRLRERHRQRASERALLRHATEDLGIDAGDARRLVFAVVRESGPTGGLAGRLRELLDSGQVHAAAVLAETVPEGGTGAGGATTTAGRETNDTDEAVLLAATEARQRVTRAMELRDMALSVTSSPPGEGAATSTDGSGAGPGPGPGPGQGPGSDPNADPDPDRAWRLLADALRLVPDLPGAEDAQRRIAPTPVPELRAVAEHRSEDAVVRLGWAESASKAGEITYQVVRRRGRPPQDAADGEVIAGTGGGGPGTGGATTAGGGNATSAPGLNARDEHPPVNVPLFYGVVARRGDAAARPAVTGPVFVRPEPYGVELTASDGLIAGRWRCPAEAARILVTREEAGPGTGPAGPAGSGPGRPVVVTADRAGMRDRVRNGMTYHYRIAAVYLGMDGREIVTPGVRRSATASAPPDPIARLSLEPDVRDSGRLNVIFDPPVNGTAELVMLPEPPPWPYGSTVTLAELRRIGRRMQATTTPGGLAVRPELSGVLLAVTVTGDNAVIGAYERHVNLPPPRGLTAERRGTMLHLGFDWPPEVAEVELTHRVGSGEPRRAAVGRAAYDADGGVRLAVPDGEEITVSVAAAGVTGGVRVTGTPVTTTIAPRTVIRYDVERAGPPWRRELVVTLTPESSPTGLPPPRIAGLVLVLRPGRVMPRRPEDGQTVASWSDLELSKPLTLTVPLPRRSGPYWLRCFIDDDAVDRPGGTPATAGPGHDGVRDTGRIELADPPVRRLQVKG